MYLVRLWRLVGENTGEELPEGEEGRVSCAEEVCCGESGAGSEDVGGDGVTGEEGISEQSYKFHSTFVNLDTKNS